MAVTAPITREREVGADAIKRLLDLVSRGLEQVNAVILRRMDSHVELIPELAGYLVNSGGKRLRPMLTLASAEMCGYQGDAHVKLAAAVEFIHTATLLHDDVVDASDLRRGRPTANLVWGNQASVLVGDFLFSRSFQLMVEADDLRVLDVLSNAAAVIAEGEVMQLAAVQNLATTEETYLKIISAKTAALFAAATKVGGMVAGRTGEEEDALYAYGHNLGIAFQLVDDALDYSGAEADLGKSVGDDFREGKITLPIVLAYRDSKSEERQFWEDCFKRNDVSEQDLARAIGYIDRSGAATRTIERARQYGEAARTALAGFPDGLHRRALLDVVDFCISRAH